MKDTGSLGNQTSTPFDLKPILQDDDTGESTLRAILFTARQTLGWLMIVSGLLGIIGNILIILVFIKLGFSNPMHISYVALAVSDLGGVLLTIWISLYNRVLCLFFNKFLMDSYHFINFTGGWPLTAFSRTTALLTAWISLERCLCVMFPLHAKTMITRAVTIRVIVIIFIIGCLPATLFYVGYYFEWLYNPDKNTTLLYVYYKDNKLNAFNQFAFLLYGGIYPVVSWVSVTICTTFLIFKLRQSTKWMTRNTTDTNPDTRNDHPNNVNQGSKRVAQTARITKTVIILASLFIFCFLPSSVHLILPVALREYSISGSLNSIFFFDAHLTLFFNELNSIANVFVFTATMTNFKTVLLKILSVK